MPRVSLDSPGGVNVGENISTSIVTTSGTTLVGTESTVLVSASAATINLAPGNDRQILTIKNIDVVTDTAIIPDGSETIDGASSLNLKFAYQSVTMQFDAGNHAWFIIATCDQGGGSFTANLSDSVGPETAIFFYKYLGNNMIALSGGIVGVSTGTTGRIGGFPTAIKPANSQTFSSEVFNNSANYPGIATIDSTSGDIILAFSSVLGTFDGVFSPIGAKGIPYTTFVYSLD